MSHLNPARNNQARWELESKELPTKETRLFAKELSKFAVSGDGDSVLSLVKSFMSTLGFRWDKGIDVKFCITELGNGNIRIAFNTTVTVDGDEVKRSYEAIGSGITGDDEIKIVESALLFLREVVYVTKFIVSDAAVDIFLPGHNDQLYENALFHMLKIPI